MAAPSQRSASTSPGLYTPTIKRSNKPKAVAFRKEVTSVAPPSIRKTGCSSWAATAKCFNSFHVTFGRGCTKARVLAELRLAPLVPALRAGRSDYSRTVPPLNTR